MPGWLAATVAAPSALSGGANVLAVGVLLAEQRSQPGRER